MQLDMAQTRMSSHASAAEKHLSALLLATWNSCSSIQLSAIPQISLLSRPNLDGSRLPTSNSALEAKDLPSSLVQLRIAVWTGVTRDTRPISDIGCALRQWF
jgi:hypothetical protein